VHSLAQRVLTYIRREELLRPGDRVGVAVSGGIDSVALLRVLLELRSELGIVLSVVHFNHKLRGAAESEGDQEFVAALAREHGVEFFVESGDVAGFAAEEHCGLEAAARELRYGFFRGLLEESAEAGTSGAEALAQRRVDRSAGSGAPPDAAPRESVPQGLKPEQKEWTLRGAEAPLFHGTAEAVPFPNPSHGAAEAAPFQNNNGELRLDKIATGHTLDDQAETVLMRVIRGTGLRGLGGIYPRILVEPEDGEGSGEIVRPLLGVRRRELEKYLREIKQPWREDSSNADLNFTRNRLRKLILPILEREFNPAVVEGLAELAEIARDEEDYWGNEVSGWLGTVVQWSQPESTESVVRSGESQPLVQISLSNPETVDPKVRVPEETAVEESALDDASHEPMEASISRPWLLTEPRAVQRRVVLAVGEEAGIPLEFKHVEEILRFAAEDGAPGKELSLPLGWRVLREAEAMVFVSPDLRQQERVADYEYSLQIPGRVSVPEIGGAVEALLLAPGADFAEYNPQQLLCAGLLPPRVVVRNWRPGDRFWPAQTKAAKKVKELLQERHIAQPQRKLWPVVVSGEEIVWMRGFPVPARLRAKPGVEAVLIREIPWNDGESF